jgi:adenylate kinase
VTDATGGVRPRRPDPAGVATAAVTGALAGLALAGRRSRRSRGAAALACAAGLTASEVIARRRQRPDEIPALGHRVAMSTALAAPLGWLAGRLGGSGHPVVAGSSPGGLRAEHRFWVFGLPFLVLHYPITRKAVSGPGVPGGAPAGRPNPTWHAGPVRLVLVGPPGSGKGTQGPIIAEGLGMPYVSTGDVLRAQVAAGSALGHRVSDLLDEGELVPDDLMLEVLADAVGGGEAEKGYVLDGFPRTLPQAEALESPVSPLPAPDCVVHIDIPDQVVHARLAGRAVEEGRTDDADPEVIDNRLRVYAEETEPLLDHYREQGILVTVDGDRPPDVVTAAILEAVAAPRPRGSS